MVHVLDRHIKRVKLYGDIMGDLLRVLAGGRSQEPLL